MQKSVAGGIAALIFHCAAAVADGAGFISFGIGFFQSIVITVARIALAFLIRAVIRAALRIVRDITVVTAVDITSLTAGAGAVFDTFGKISAVIGTLSGRISGEGTGSDGISLVSALLHGIDFIAVVSAHGSEACVAAVSGAEETDGGGFIGFVGLFKLKGGLRFGCVCMCRQAGGNS